MTLPRVATVLSAAVGGGALRVDVGLGQLDAVPAPQALARLGQFRS